MTKNIKYLAICLVLLACGFANPAKAEPLIGVLAVPSVFAYSEELTETPTLDVRESPLADAPVIATVSRDIVNSPLADDLYLHEVAYEEPGFDVLQQQDGWYRVLLRHTDESKAPVAGWVLAPHDAVYTELSEKLQNSLLDLLPAWDGKLYVSPASQELAPIKPQKPAIAAELLQSRSLSPEEAQRVVGIDVSAMTVLDGQRWVKVHLRNNCVMDDADDSFGDGWVRVPDDWRQLINHYSRGC